MSGESHTAFYNGMPNKKTESTQGCSDQVYQNFLESIQQSFHQSISNGEQIFKTRSGKDLFEIFLKHIPSEYRQHYNCNTCRSFMKKYGGLVIINKDGNKIPIMWDMKFAPTFFSKSIIYIYNTVRKANINGVFYSDKSVLGFPETAKKMDQSGKVWKHMAVTGCPVHSKAFKTVIKQINSLLTEMR